MTIHWQYGRKAGFAHDLCAGTARWRGEAYSRRGTRLWHRRAHGACSVHIGWQSVTASSLSIACLLSAGSPVAARSARRSARQDAGASKEMSSLWRVVRSHSKTSSQCFRSISGWKLCTNRQSETHKDDKHHFEFDTVGVFHFRGNLGLCTHSLK